MANPLLTKVSGITLAAGLVTAYGLLGPISAKAEEALPVPEMTDVQATGDTAFEGFAGDREALREEIRKFLLEEPEIIVEAMQVLEQRRLIEQEAQEQEAVAALGDALYDDGFSYVGGNPEGSITVIEFQDYRCGYCKRAHGDVQALVEADGDVRLVVKEFPILGPDSDRTSRLAIATLITQGPDAYKRISDALMTYGGPINDGALERVASGANIDLDAALAVIDDAEIDRRLEATMQVAQALDIRGTPTFVIGRKVVRGYVPLEEMQNIVALGRELQD